jgi:D-alanyl-lipoteichoic acid acyltransferase DltB (MBOAT superfamily)
MKFRPSTRALASPATAGGVAVDASLAGPTAAIFERSRALVQQITLVLQLALLALIIRQFDIESAAFLNVCLLAFAGAVVTRVLPRAQRLPLFAALSIAAIVMVFGIVQSAWLIGFGAALIAICHLPVPFKVRVAVLLVVGAGLAALRSYVSAGPWSAALWPILGSMFMFRLIVYMYDLRHETGPRSWPRTIAYFFMLPNVCFPMFPVVDYKAFKRTYYNDDEFRIQQVGVQWIFRGLTQLILYRLVYYYFTMSAADVTNPADFGRFVVANYLLYLRISGQFHVVVGILRLFGFNLPETHHRYLFASSINDFWRRINIYWKDFMMKLFYYPSFFALRKRGWSETSALILATIVVFASTWLLHSYQWFWLRGQFPLAWPDALFWGILGVLVVANTLYEAKRGRKRRLNNTRVWTPAAITGTVLQTALTFCFICVLWSLWTAESVSQWLHLWTRAFGQGISASTMQTLAFGAVAIAVGSAGNAAASRVIKTPALQWSTLMTTAAIAATVVVTHPRVYNRLDARVGSLLDSLREQKLNRQDAALLERGYYENLLSVERFNSQLWELYSKRPANWANLRDSGGMRQVDSFFLEELIPSMQMSYKGTMFKTNRWGMRDIDFEVAKPAGTYRFAVFGPSDSMGTGVEADQTFSSVFRDRMNEAGLARQYQVLNFSASNYTPIQHLTSLERRALQFTLDAAILVGHDDDENRVIRHVASALARHVEIPYPFIKDLAVKAGVAADMTEQEILERLRPYSGEAARWTYKRFAEVCREHQIVPVWLFLPFLVQDVKAADPALMTDAKNAGFVIVDLSRLYHDKKVADFRVAPWDHHHPNVVGHSMIADRLMTSLRGQDQTLQLGIFNR